MRGSYIMPAIQAMTEMTCSALIHSYMLERLNSSHHG